MAYKNKKFAWFNWSEEEKKWILRLWISNNWEFSKSWKVKDIDEDSYMGWVSDSIVSEIAYLQDLGYSVKVTC